VAGGQPSITYVQREELQMERQLARALAAPNQIVSLSGPTKTGKTVLCHKVLGEKQYLWVDGGKIKGSDDFWDIVRHELKIPAEVEEGAEVETTIGVEGDIFVLTANGSRLSRQIAKQTRHINTLSEVVSFLTLSGIILVIDDFHYIDRDTRMVLMRNVKGAVFNGLKVLLLSVTHRAFDAIRAESELTGRFTAITLPTWAQSDLARIPELGFSALGVRAKEAMISQLAKEAQESPFLMQKFCWEICYDCDVERPKLLGYYSIPDDYNLEEMYIRLAKDAGLPIYQRLVAGPQSRKKRTKRPLKTGKYADIYEATLLALAETGPKAVISYDDLRASFGSLLTDMMPQKHEITSALKHLRNISMKTGTDPEIDWDDDKREINITDPYLRFYLRWQIRDREKHSILDWTTL
jgi:hypothetical protein